MKESTTVDGVPVPVPVGGGHAGPGPGPSSAFAGAHDHDRCVSAAMEAAESLCRARGVRLTALRRRVLELVWSGHEPLGAYDILRLLSSGDRPAAPPTVYRALDFLLANGLVHRLESLSAFVGCCRPGKPHAGQFLICTSCRQVAELADKGLGSKILSSASAQGFQVVRQTVEVSGLCAACGAGAAP